MGTSARGTSPGLNNLHQSSHQFRNDGLALPLDQCRFFESEGAQPSPLG